MRSPSDAPEREPYWRALKALLELAQALLTLHTVTTLDARNLTNLVVENITALLDELQRGQPISQRLHAFRRTLDKRLAILTATAELDQEAAAYQQLGEAMHHMDSAFARIDAMAARTRSNLNNAIRSVKDAFWQLARTEDPTDRELLNNTIRSIQATIDEFADTLDSFGYERASGVRDGVNSRVTVVDSQPRERPSLAEQARKNLHRPPRDDLGGGMSPFDR